MCYCWFLFYYFFFCIFFFFQAEDGIRDWSVTGVQTCALPIYTEPPATKASLRRGLPVSRFAQCALLREGIRNEILKNLVLRSEERRVGKECRYGWWVVY